MQDMTLMMTWFVDVKKDPYRKIERRKDVKICGSNLHAPGRNNAKMGQKIASWLPSTQYIVCINTSSSSVWPNKHRKGYSFLFLFLFLLFFFEGNMTCTLSETYMTKNIKKKKKKLGTNSSCSLLFEIVMVFSSWGPLSNIVTWHSTNLRIYVNYPKNAPTK